MTKHTPREMKASDRSLWGDTPFCSQVRMARIVEHSPMNGMDAEHLTNEFAKRWNCHDGLLKVIEAIVESYWECGGQAIEIGDTIIGQAEAEIAKAKGLAV